ncbi:ABC transporter permease [Roseateles sp. DAIF2]|uniref:ABC transporter permease n=1 Tax=Roseateles sp. DAIF2 TaxID=2714952 RepID=UPI001BC95BDB|nr:FtsX-like permease family protein [Roseateles sp. DAIF2]
MMDILPILSTLKRHKTAAGLIVLQIALTCAIVCNALFLISERLHLIGAPTGMAERELLVIGMAGIVRAENADAQTRADLQALRGLPGVKSVALVNQIPFGTSSHGTGLRTKPDPNQRDIRVSSYNAGEGWLETLGLKLVEGRDFEPAEYVDASVVFSDGVEPKVPAVIINQHLAKRLAPDGSALGRLVYLYGPDAPQRVVGVLERLPSTYPRDRDESDLNAVMQPIRGSYRGGNYVLRVEPAQRDAVLKQATETLVKGSVGIKRVVRHQRSLEEMRDGYYRQDRFMVGLLLAVCLAMLVVTAFGIVGLASFWVQQRSRMIGTRRALGATRTQILRYFQTENLLLSSIGIGLGMLLAYAINAVLMTQYELPRLPLAYLPIGALVLWALGQLAVLAPARRASNLPPMMVMRGLA